MYPLLEGNFILPTSSLLLRSLGEGPLQDASISSHTHDPEPVGADLHFGDVTTVPLADMTDHTLVVVPHLQKGRVP